MAHPASTGTLGAAGAFKAGLALVRAGLAVGKVNAQQFAMGGLLPGPSHAQGGMPILNPMTGQVVAEVEGGEPLLSKATYVHNKPIVDALLDASQNRGGASIMADGGQVPSLGTSVTATGAVTATAPNATDPANNAEVLAMLQAVHGQLVALNANFPANIKGKWVYQDFEKFKGRIESDDAFSSI